MPNKIRIATRASELALRQAGMVQAALHARGIDSELVKFTTTGDKRLGEPLSEIGAKGLFTKELEVALLNGDVDCCVHSLKDLPTESQSAIIAFPAGTAASSAVIPAKAGIQGGSHGSLEIIAQLEREDPRDVVVLGPGANGKSLFDLPAGARVGTSSLRRRAQLLSKRPDLKVVDLRGNVPTRLDKVARGEVDAAILAAAGLIRLGMTDRIHEYLDAPDWLPAPGQGAIAIQVRGNDQGVREIMYSLNHSATSSATAAERSFLRALEGGCQVPIGALAKDGVLYGIIAHTNGSDVVDGSLPIDSRNPVATGTALAAVLERQGGAAILEAVRSMQQVTPAPSPQPE